MQDRARLGSLALHPRRALDELVGEAALVVAAVGVAGRMVVMVRFAATRMQVVLQTDGLAAMMMMGHDGHRQHQDAEQEQQCGHVGFPYHHGVQCVELRKDKDYFFSSSLSDSIFFFSRNS